MREPNSPIGVASRKLSRILRQIWAKEADSQTEWDMQWDELEEALYDYAHASAKQAVTYARTGF